MDTEAAYRYLSARRRDSYQRLEAECGSVTLRLHRDRKDGFFYVATDDGRLVADVVSVEVRDGVDFVQQCTLTFLVRHKPETEV